MNNTKVVNYKKVKQCINAEAKRVSGKNLDGVKSADEKYFLRAWCIKRCEWCDAELDVKQCPYSTDD